MEEARERAGKLHMDLITTFLEGVDCPITLALGESELTFSPLGQDDDEEHQLLLKESDYIAFFDQFPFTEVFRYILVVPDEGTDAYQWSMA